MAPSNVQFFLLGFQHFFKTDFSIIFTHNSRATASASPYFRPCFHDICKWYLVLYMISLISSKCLMISATCIVVACRAPVILVSTG
jgi:hypothetical protein